MPSFSDVRAKVAKKVSAPNRPKNAKQNAMNAMDVNQDTKTATPARRKQTVSPRVRPTRPTVSPRLGLRPKNKLVANRPITPTNKAKTMVGAKKQFDNAQDAGKFISGPDDAKKKALNAETKKTVVSSGDSPNSVGTNTNNVQSMTEAQKAEFAKKQGQGTGVPGGQLVGDNGPSQNPQGIGQGNTGQGTLSEGTVVNESLTGTKKQTPRVATTRRSIRGFKKGGTFTRKSGCATRKAKSKGVQNKLNNMKVFKEVMNEQRQRG